MFPKPKTAPKDNAQKKGSGGGDFGAPPSIGSPPPMGGGAEGGMDEEPDGGEQGGAPKPDPMKAGFRDAGETCESCEYNLGGHCAMLDIPIGSGCNFYEAQEGGGGDMEGGGGAGEGSGAGGPGMGGPPMAMGGMAPARRTPPMPMQKRGM